MKKKDVDELKNKSTDQIKKVISDLEKEIMNAKMDTKQENVKNVHGTRSKRRDVAKAKTILTMKVLTEAQMPKEKNVAK